MSAIALSCIAFVCISGGVLIGMFLRNTLPEHHLSTDAKDVVRLGTGLIGTIAALVLGLLIASAKNSYDTQSTQIKQMTASIILLDHPDPAKAQPFQESAASEAFYAKLQELSPQNDSQRSLQTRAIQISTDIAQTRLLLFAQMDNSIPMPFLVVLIFWLTIIFASFSLFAQPNVIVIGSLLIFALSAAGAIYLVLELGQPFAGLMQISSTPLRSALTPFNL